VARQANELRYAIRPRVVLKYSGQLGLAFAVLTLIPLGVSIAFGDGIAAARYALVIASLSAAGAALAPREAPPDVQINEGVVVVGVMFLLAPLAIAYPLMSGGMSFADALFEAVSAITTTGLSTRANLAHASPAFVFGRAWMQ
jgi:trk system potassium uptake protein TrkH